MNDKSITSPLKAIRLHCLDCCCGSPVEVRLCPSKECPLYSFRIGNNPFHKRTLTEEQRQALRDRISRARSLR